ncbi:MAG: hypothetical protein JWP87_4939 [Labilithrix sp.]|nr:hypothetical protein [Labilithrix sp.]
MTPCSQLEDIEALVLGELDATRAARLEAHAARCVECRAELELTKAERALFSQRACAMLSLSAPPPAPVFVESERATSRPAAVARSVVPAALRLLRRGHVSAACAAALFVVAAFSRIGNPAPNGGTSSMSASGEDEEPPGMLASIASFASRSGASEPLACSPGGSAFVSRVATDDGASSSSSGAASSSHGSLGEVLACGAREASRSTASCEPSVTCSWLRQ